MKTYNLALIGFGGVNRALAEIVLHEGERLQALGVELKVVAISDLKFGSLRSNEGINLARVLKMPAGDNFSVFDGGSADAATQSVISESAADIVVEATFTNPIDAQPALSHMLWALNSGKHVVTTNKGPVALRANELKMLAASQALHFLYEGTVLSGTPVLGLAREQLAGLAIDGFEGILNGTSNYVLGRMGLGEGLAAAVKEAQHLGLAEADPTADIGGGDVRLKVTILANELLGASLHPDDVHTLGLEALSPDDITGALLEGKTWKLVGSAHRRDDGTIDARVAPIALPNDHPLASVTHATNALSIHTDLLGSVTIVGPGAGRRETAYAILSDILAIHRSSGVSSDV